MDIKAIIEIAGGPTAVAALFGISSQAVSQWKQVPVERCLALEEATGGKVTRYDMCPRIFGKAPAKPRKRVA
ncbi:DNA-binding transcriptional regulator YdaS (Cro superfamily) [Dyella sp. SG562]|uniref:Cro/CI family transcriptional regulator n=1 Tax=Dyella sp. SG562 TaxID=2587017 RepID=UPI001424810C|nr:Cro/CI family transcriptional regulator [Dyella sp. SG562]NII73226.1 DNA-binding transcriptional regulator YdaS (Cro superfamily) [Dyella sp. SG562]